MLIVSAESRAALASETQETGIGKRSISSCTYIATKH